MGNNHPKHANKFNFYSSKLPCEHKSYGLEGLKMDSRRILGQHNQNQQTFFLQQFVRGPKNISAQLFMPQHTGNQRLQRDDDRLNRIPRHGHHKSLKKNKYEFVANI